MKAPLRKPLRIVKIGGRLINDAAMLDAFIQAFISITEPCVLIHGGGRKTTELSALLGIEAKIVEGRRITDAETLEVAIMVYAGLINKNIVARLQSHHTNAIGLSGADGDVIRAHKRAIREIDYGWVGDIDNVNGQALHSLLSMNMTPVLCAISHDGQGQLLNTNADTIATQVALALIPYYDVTLTFCFEYNGVLYDVDAPDLTMRHISEGEFINMRTSGTVNSGMIPKLSNGFDALKGGVTDVRICGIDNLSSFDNATQLTR
jgi:acetylglutamate kinase